MNSVLYLESLIISLYFLSLVSDLRLEPMGVEDLDKLLINTLFEVSLYFVRIVGFICCLSFL